MKVFINTVTKCLQRDILKVAHLLSGTVEHKCPTVYLHNRCVSTHPCACSVSWVWCLHRYACGFCFDGVFFFCFLDVWPACRKLVSGIILVLYSLNQVSQSNPELVGKAHLASQLNQVTQTIPFRAGDTGRLLCPLSVARLLGPRTLNLVLVQQVR